MSEIDLLTHQDLQGLLLALINLYSAIGEPALWECASKSLNSIIPADTISFDFFDLNGVYNGKRWSNESISPTAEDLEVYKLYAHQNPVFVEAVLKQKTTPVKITDYISDVEFRNTDIYNNFYKLIDANNQIALALPISEDFVMTCLLARSIKDFSERDRVMMTLAAPHLINVVKNTFAFDRVNAALNEKGCGVITVDSFGKAQYVSEFAYQLLERYFEDEKRAENSLPENLCSWIKKNDLPANEFALPTVPFKVKNAQGELTVRLIYNSTTLERTLLLEEKKSLTPKMLESLNLTKREAQVLYWMAQGKSDADIAVLCNISPNTVYKHAQHIYKKLGVETRTAAMLRALEVL